MSNSCRDTFDLSGRVAIITGGGGMLGRRHAEALAEFGADVILADVSFEKADAVAKEIATQFGTQVMGIGTDITSKDSIVEMVEQVVARFGKIDILINNAAMTVEHGGTSFGDYFAPFEEYSETLWEAALKVNLTGLFLCTQAVGNVMCKQEKGVIINIASDVGVISPDHRIYEGETFNTPISYCVSKTGVLGFTRYMATYWAEKNIRVNAVSPAGVFNDHAPEFVEKLAHRIPLGRMAHKDEYKGTIVYLASDASSFMTGANLVIDGGRTIW